MKKKIFSILTILFISISQITFALEIPKHTNEFYVNDFANVLSRETKNYIIKKGEELNKADGLQIVVTTIKNLEGNEIFHYSREMAKKWKIGSDEKNNGILILLAVEDRDIFVQIGYGLEGDLNDAKVGRLIDTYAIPYLKNDNFDEGILNLYKGILQTLNLSEDAPISATEEKRELSYFEIIVIMIVLILYLRIGPRRRFIGKGPFTGGGFSGGRGVGGGRIFGGGGKFGGGGAGRKF